jgi:hypothetical protein
MVKKKEKKLIKEISKLAAEVTLADEVSKKKSKKVKKVEVWPKVNKGTHLTVTTFEDGSTKLEWDDEALLSEVRNAILKHESTIPVAKEMKPAVKAKALTRKKKEKL